MNSRLRQMPRRWLSLLGAGCLLSAAPRAAEGAAPAPVEAASVSGASNWAAAGRGRRPGGLPPATVWAQAGATGWKTCMAYDRAAAQVLAPGAVMPAAALWGERARECGGAPNVLVAAAKELLLEGIGVELAKLEPEELVLHARQRARRIEAARRLLRRAKDAARGEGRYLPEGTLYLEAYAALAAGEARRAESLVRAALLAGDVPTWRARRLLAAASALDGRYARALILGQRALADAESVMNGRPAVTAVLLAWICDRLGDSTAAAAYFDEGGTRRNPAVVLSAAAMLPFHERLYVLALYQAHVGNLDHARALFTAYLRESGAAEPDKELARRHLATLRARTRPR